MAQPLSCGVVVLAALGLDAIPLIADVPTDYSRTGTLLILMFLFAFARIRFIWAISTAPLLVAGYAGVQAIENTPADQVLYNDFFLLSFVVIGVSTSYTLERLRRLEFVRRRELSVERQRSDDLLHNILPEEVATRLRNNHQGSIADSEADASVMFADIVGFTPFSSLLPPAEVVRLLDMLFNRFDDLCEGFGIEKIKTIGDAYMAVAGIPRPDPAHATSMVELAFAMQRAASDVSPHWPAPLALRIGIASGPVVAGVIGHKKFAYDLWGDTVNTASRMESHGRPNRIQVSESTYELLRDRYAFGDPQKTEIKGKGSMTTYFLLGPDTL
ncbi:adenylate/guanylate cyclase domain-containing protein [Aeromicrobium sp.]|uniref:adenylate/guanylate cyclase domain-containing protein n=1 Tax=Aeromicrobium sp. TaxID=1871063 RepID=UPI003C3AD9E0